MLSSTGRMTSPSFWTRSEAAMEAPAANRSLSNDSADQPAVL